MPESCLPTAAELLAKALVERVEIDGHKLNYDAANDLIWITNPYGVDAGIIHPNEDSVANFLKVIASGEMYGPEP
jgi:hypothetical protein